MDQIGGLDGPDSLSRVSSRAPKKYTMNSFQVVGLHNVVA